MQRSLLKRFPLLFGFCLPVSSVSNFRPDTGGQSGLLFRFASSVQSCCGEGAALQTDIAMCGAPSQCSGHTGFAPLTGVCAFPVYTAQAPGCSIWSRPCVACGSSFRVLHKSVESVGPAFYAFPARAAQAARGLGALSPVRCAFSPPRAQPQFPRARRCCAPYVCSGELSLAATLWANVSHPESQEVFG